MSSDEQKPRGMFGRLFGGGRPAAPAAAPAVPAAPSTSAPSTSAPAQPAASPEPEPVAVAVEPPAAPPARGGWFQRLTSGLAQTSKKLSDGLSGVFTRRKLDAATLDDLEDVLLQADLGIATTEQITATLRATRYERDIAIEEVRAVLAEAIVKVLTPVAKPLLLQPSRGPHVILVVGVNGTGKTTTIGKLAARYRGEGRRVMIAAGDTFRAAAVEQLKVWGERAGVPVVARATGADAAGLAYDALEQARREGVEVLLIDTAGRLQNKAALMDELDKVVRVLRRVDASAPHDVVLVLDATTGQNALNQVEVFKDRAGVTGLIMTKLDGTARGGILVAISAKFGLPVHAIGVGEGIDDLQAFDPGEFARAIAGA